MNGTARVCRRVAAWSLTGSAVAAVAVGAGINSTPQTHDRPDAWPMFRGSPMLGGTTNTTLPAPLTLRWSYQAKDSIESSAAIVDGVVYVGVMDGHLLAVDLETGALRWQYQTAGPVEESSPCVSAGVVYVGDLEGVVHAVDASTGKAKWTFKTQGEIKSSPNRSGDRVYIGSYDQCLYALSAGGSLVWKFRAEGPVHATPAVDGDTVYISGCDEHLRAIDATTGAERFAVPLGAYAGASAALRDGQAVVGTFGNEVQGVDLRTRAIRWTYEDATRSFPFYSSAALTDTRAVVGGRDKLVHGLDRQTGKSAWTFTTKARVESSPLVAGTRVFIGSNDGILYELDVLTGTKTWEFTAGAPISASPAAAQGALVIGSQDGVLYCFGKRGGS